MAREGIPGLEPGKVESSCELVRTTLGELGAELPHGLLGPDGWIRSFAFHPANMGTRKRLGALKTRTDLRDKPGRHTAYWLATALSELGGEPLGKVERGASKIASLCAGDVLYLLFYWQHSAHPEGMPLVAQDCGVCGEAFDRVLVDLRTLEVLRLAREGDLDGDGKPLEVPDATDPPTARVGLHHGFPFPRDQVSRTVALRAPTWADTFYRVTAPQLHNAALMQAYTLQAGIAATDTVGAVARLPMDAIDELMPADVALLEQAAAKITSTPVLELVVECPSCRTENRTSLDWQVPGFFGRSSVR